ADREEHHVEPAQRLDELALLGQSKRGRMLGCYCMRCHASLSTSPRIPVISSNSCCVAMRGGEICTTGSPRSSALQIKPFSNSRGDRKPRRSASHSSWVNDARVSLSLTSSSA